MADYPIPPKNVAFVFEVSLTSQADTKLFQQNPTLATGDVKVQTDDGSLADITTLPTGAASSSRVKVSLSAGEMNGDNVYVQFRDAAGAEWCDLSFNVQTTARGMADLAYPATSGRSMVVDAAGLVDANMVKAGPTGAGTAQTAGDILAKILKYVQLLARKDAAIATDNATELTAINASGGSGGGAYVSTTDALEALRDNTGTAGAGLTALGDTRIANLDATIASRMATFTLPTFFSALSINASGHISRVTLVDTLTTYTGNTPQTGDVFAQTNSGTFGLAAIKGYIDDIGVAGVGLTAIPWNSAWDAEVQSEVDDALIAQGLDHLVNAAVTGTDIVDNSIIAKLVSKSATADWDSYVNTTDALEALRDNTGTAGAGLTALGDTRLGNLDAAVTSRMATFTLPTFFSALSINASGHISRVTLTDDVTTKTGYRLSATGVDDVWDEAIAGHLTAGTTGLALNSASSAGDPWSTALPGAYGAGTAGKIVGDNINATISSRAEASTALSTAQWTSGRAGNLDFLDVAVSSRLASASYSAPPSTAAIRAEIDSNSVALAAIYARTDVATSSRLATSGYTVPPTAIQNAVQTWGTVLGTSKTAEQMLGYAATVVAGTIGTAGEGIEIFNFDGFQVRITVDDVGNRSAVAYVDA